MENHPDCLSFFQASPTHTEKCLPLTKLPGCQPEVLEALTTALLDDLVPPEPIPDQPIVIGGVGGLPPPYLTVPNHQDCLGSFTPPGATHTSFCMPVTKPENCPDSSWSDLQDKFSGQPCPTIVGGLGGLPPAYLSVQGYQDCLGDFTPTGSTHSQLCLPSAKPDPCLDPSWAKIQDVFDGLPCPVTVGGQTGLPPAYLSIPGYADCLQEFQASSTHTELCLPNIKPAECYLDSWTQILDVFEGAKCPLKQKVGLAQPDYLQIEGHDRCLNTFQASPTHVEFCKPKNKPEGKFMPFIS